MVFWAGVGGGGGVRARACSLTLQTCLFQWKLLVKIDPLFPKADSVQSVCLIDSGGRLRDTGVVFKGVSTDQF